MVEIHFPCPAEGNPLPKEGLFNGYATSWTPGVPTLPQTSCCVLGQVTDDRGSRGVLQGLHGNVRSKMLHPLLPKLECEAALLVKPQL